MRSYKKFVISSPWVRDVTELQIILWSTKGTKMKIDEINHFIYFEHIK